MKLHYLPGVLISCDEVCVLAMCVAAANTFSGNRSSVYSLCIDPAGKLLVSGSSDKVRLGAHGGRGFLPYLGMNVCDVNMKCQTLLH